MTVNTPPRSQNAPQNVFATRRTAPLARAALLAGGATTGLLASALAGFGLVALMFPNSGLPGTGGAPLTAAAYLPAPVTVQVMPETKVTMVRPAPAPAPVPAPAAAPETLSAVTPAATPAVTPAATPAALAVPGPVPQATGSLPPVDVAAAPIAAPTPAPQEAATTRAAPADDAASQEPDFVLASKSAPEDAFIAPTIDTSTFGPRIAMLPPMDDAAASEPAPTGPEDFAMLSEADAAARAGAGLFAEPAVAAVEPPAATDPIRPARRPESFADQLAAYEPPAETAAPATSIRPAPRPAVLLAAAPAPQAPAQAPAAAPAAAAPAEVVKVAARQSGGGFLSGGSANCGRSLARAMPTRRGGATGSAFFAGLTNVSGPDRDARAIAELARGNMPAFLRDLQPVTFRGQDARGAAVEITICVTPDYLALGSDSDHVRVPLGLPAAARIAGAFDMTLPTPRMVDAIYAQANVKLSPAPMQPGAQMSTTAYFVTHNATIEKQLQGRRGLVGGHKKDVVMASRMASAPGRVAIYGWHQSNGAPIQPVSTVHGANYADYSHGIRLVSKTAFLNGKAVALDELLASSRYAYLLNSDGPMPGPVIRTASN